MYSTTEQRTLFDWSKKFLQQDITASQIDDLRKILVFHEWKYYIQNDPVLSDFEYDTLYKKLEAIEAAHPELITSDSPTQRVSNDLIEDFLSVEHLSPMLSLGNSYNAEDLLDFDTQIKKLAHLPEGKEVEYVVEPKFDGGGIALVFENNQLTRAATRGNGTKGEEITLNARTMRSIPLHADFEQYHIQKIELRGEVVIRKDLFEKMNQQRAAKGLSLYANPRNTATGGLRVKDPKEAAKRNLEAFVYQVGTAVDAEGNSVLKQMKTHNETIEMLGALGFKIPTIERKVCKNIQEAIDFCLDWEKRREAYHYEIDGMVIKVNSLELQDKCGFTAHHPRWAIAFKFKAKQATSKLLNVEYQIGKIGSVTPVAKLEPVALAGVTVTSVSLHNEDFITGKDIRIGDTVLVERAGDVIPYIVKPMEELRDGNEQKIVFPTHCPSCNTPLVRAEGEAAWRCDNSINCEAQVLQRMIFHVSKDAMDIDGFGKSYVER
ncbi:MAG TPA: NAD-dependent DNA ligase LigA, partial [Phaeodactylibacter sp.]|nr:NAD-dependent DNA ligase LigA [Phaeodactylibacter sp.]